MKMNMAAAGSSRRSPLTPSHTVTASSRPSPRAAEATLVFTSTSTFGVSRMRSTR